MTWRAALRKYYESFGLPAYPEESVPEDVIYPWLTYSVSKGDFADTTTAVLHLHYHTESETVPNSKADEICNGIRHSAPITCDKGKLILNTGRPEWISTPDQTDSQHKHRIINIEIQWLLVE